MTLLRELLRESVTEEQHQRFEQWKRDCKKADPNCSFTGSIGIGAQAVNWIDPGNRVVGDWDGKTFTGTVNRKVNEGEDVTYQVGEKVMTLIGGKWLSATITKPPHAETGNYGVRVKHGTKTINTVSSPNQLKKV